MTIGRHDCKTARNTDFRQAIAIGLDEALTALEECFYDLTDQQIAAFPIEGHNSIAWIVMHSLQNLDEYTNLAHGGQPTFEHDWRWNLWRCRDDERPRPGDPFPSHERIMQWLASLREVARRALDTATDQYLGSKPDTRWPGNVADMYMRTTHHTHAHVRQVWLLRGALGLTDGNSWPQQHWT